MQKNMSLGKTKERLGLAAPVYSERSIPQEPRTRESLKEGGVAGVRGKTRWLQPEVGSQLFVEEK